MLFPIDKNAARMATPLHWVDEFRYLRVVVTKHPSNYLEKNLLPQLSTLRAKCSSWDNLPLNLLGRIKLIKIVT